MQKNIPVLCLTLFFLLLRFPGASQLPGNNLISGNIKNLSKDFLQLFVEDDINRKKNTLVATIPVDKNGHFRFEKKLVPHVYSLKITDQRSVMLAIDKGQRIVVSGDLALNQPLQVSGSRDTEKLEAYEKFRKESLDRLVNSVRKQLRELRQKGMPENDPQILSLTKLEVDNYELHRDELIGFIKNEMGSSLAIYPTSIRWGGEKNISFLLQLARRFEQAYPTTEIAKRITEKVNILKANAIGGKVSEIKMPDRNGKMVTLSLLKGKYVLIDFWASWCAPCRKETGLLGDLHNTYGAKGLTILGVSLDTDMGAWTKAIQSDNRNWLNVSTLEGFETTASYQYAVTSLPANVLVDGSGKVIAKNIHGEELASLIDQLFSSQR